MNVMEKIFEIRSCILANDYQNQHIWSVYVMQFIKNMSSWDH